MRAEILDYCQGLNLGTVTVSQEYPWTDNGAPLYLKNLKKVYVDMDVVTTDPVITALNGLSLINETTSVRIYFANDAKVILPNYQDIVADLKTAKDATGIDGVQRREVQVTTSSESDVLVTEIEIRFTKLLT